MHADISLIIFVLDLISFTWSWTLLMLKMTSAWDDTLSICMRKTATKQSPMLWTFVFSPDTSPTPKPPSQLYPNKRFKAWPRDTWLCARSMVLLVKPSVPPLDNWKASSVSLKPTPKWGQTVILLRLYSILFTYRLSDSVDSQDVEEAIRLVREAMLTNAIDPLTGRIDMDLINTGKSSALRERQADLKRQIKLLLSNRQAPQVDFGTLHAEMSAQSSIVSLYSLCNSSNCFSL